MNYIILAAGIGKRLHPLTNNNPKCLFKLDARSTILERTIQSIRKVDSGGRIIIVTGFCHEKIYEAVKDFDNITFVYNPFFRVTNSVASLWFAREFLVGDTVIFNSDIVYEERIAREILVKTVSGAVVLLDSSIKADGDYNVQVHGDKVAVMSKELTEYYGEYAGITKLSGEATKQLLCEIESMVDDGDYDQWYENALVQMIFSNDFTLGYIDLATYHWTEVDNVNDLLEAKKIHFMEK